MDTATIEFLVRAGLASTVDHNDMTVAADDMYESLDDRGLIVTYFSVRKLTGGIWSLKFCVVATAIPMADLTTIANSVGNEAARGTSWMFDAVINGKG